jgi:hypothetical protein
MAHAHSFRDQAFHLTQRNQQRHHQESDHHGFAEQWRNESESFGHRVLPEVLSGSVIINVAIHAAQLWRIVAAARW